MWLQHQKQMTLMWRIIKQNPSYKTAGRGIAPESQLTAEQSSTGRHWNSPKKIPHIQRQRRSPSEMVGGAQSQKKSNPITTGWMTHKLENNYTTEAHPLEWRFWAPRQASRTRCPAMGRGIPRESDFEGQRYLTEGLWQVWEKQRLHSCRAHTE